MTVKVYSGATATGTPVQTLTTTRPGAAWTVNASSALASGHLHRAGDPDRCRRQHGHEQRRTRSSSTPRPRRSFTAPADDTATRTRRRPSPVPPEPRPVRPERRLDHVTVKIYSGATTGGRWCRPAPRPARRDLDDRGEPALADGTYTAEATQTDSRRQHGTSNDDTFVIDNDGPTVTIAAPTAASRRTTRRRRSPAPPATRAPRTRTPRR